MMKNSVALMACILLLSSAAVLANQGNFGPDECCFHFISTRLRKNNVLSYQKTDKRCSSKGVLFTTKNGGNICADPSERWVKFLMEAIERLQTNSPKGNF